MTITTIATAITANSTMIPISHERNEEPTSVGQGKSTNVTVTSPFFARAHRPSTRVKFEDVTQRALAEMSIVFFPWNESEMFKTAFWRFKQPVTLIVVLLSIWIMLESPILRSPETFTPRAEWERIIWTQIAITSKHDSSARESKAPKDRNRIYRPVGSNNDQISSEISWNSLSIVWEDVVRSIAIPWNTGDSITRIYKRN